MTYTTIALLLYPNAFSQKVVKAGLLDGNKITVFLLPIHLSNCMSQCNEKLYIYFTLPVILNGDTDVNIDHNKLLCGAVHKYIMSTK
jgi:hypothetical protein